MKAIVAAALMLALAACGNGEPDQAPQDDPHAAHRAEDGVVQLSGEVAARLGVTLEDARREDLQRTVRAPGEVVADETRLSTVSLRFGGWAEGLFVDHTGQLVRAGEALLRVYSPELVSAQEDLLSARRLADEMAGARVPGSRERADAMVAAARDRLRFWQLSEAEIRRLEETNEVLGSTDVEAPFSGYVVEKNVQAGERFEAGAPLYRLAELSRVWLEVETYERDIAFLQVGTRVEVELAAHPDGMVEGEITYIYPQMERERRTARARVELPNPGGHLKPGMYGTARSRVVVARDAVTVSRDAVMHTGTRSVVFVGLGGGRYEIREVRVGAEAGGRVQILSGLDAGEPVVARAGFILDSESRLMEAMMGQPGMPGMDIDMEGDMEMEMEEETEMEEGTEMEMEMGMHRHLPSGASDA